jgi:hypothetical protein
LASSGSSTQLASVGDVGEGSVGTDCPGRRRDPSHYRCLMDDTTMDLAGGGRLVVGAQPTS